VIWKKEGMVKELSLTIIVFLCLSILLHAQTENWVFLRDGPIGWSDEVFGVGYSTTGLIFAAGYITSTDSSMDFAVLCLDTAGIEQWMYAYPDDPHTDSYATAIACDLGGSAYVTGSTNISGSDYTVVRIDTSGVIPWSYTYDSDLGKARDIVFGGDGNLHTVGLTLNGTDNCTSISVNTSGGERWVYAYGWPHGSDGLAIDFGDDGNIYLAGTRTDTSGLNDDFVIISVNNSGIERWDYVFNGAANGQDQANSIVYGSDGNIYAAGFVSDTGVGSDFAVISVTNLGVERWVYLYDSTDIDEAFDVAYGLDGNVYAAGDDGNDFVVISLDPSGNERWVYEFDGNGQGYDYAYSIVCGPDTNLYVCGHSTEDGLNGVVVIISLDVLGNERWVYKYNRPGNGGDVPYGMVYGGDGNLYVGGTSDIIGLENDMMVLSVNPVLGVEEDGSQYPQRKIGFSVYPNPFFDLVDIRLLGVPENGCLGESVIKIFDLSGRVIEEIPIPKSHLPNVRVEWDGKDIAPGVYFLSVEGMVREKIVKIK
jgi:hypothetical protein